MKKIEYGFNPGQRFGRWTILDRYVFSARGEKKYLCRCDCGTERYVLERSLKYGGSQSCGCLRKERAYQATAYNLLGQTFGELRVIGRSRKRTEMGGVLDVPVQLRLHLRGHGSGARVRAQDPLRLQKCEELCYFQYYRAALRPADRAVPNEKA